MITLTPTQERILKEVSQQEGRHPTQMLSMLMSEGVSYFYCDRVAPFSMKGKDVSDAPDGDLWDEAQDFHKREYNGFMQPISDEAYTALIKEWNKPTEDELPEYEDHPSEYYDKLLNEQ